MPRLKSVGLLIVLLLTLCGLGRAQDYVLQARVEPAVARAGESVQYRLKVIYQNKVPPSPMPPRFEASWGFSTPVSTGTSSGSNMTIGIGRSASEMWAEYGYQFQVSKEGTFQIPPSGFTAAGTEYKSNPVTLTVLKADTTPGAVAAAAIPTELQGRIVPPTVRGNPQLQNALNGAVFILAENSSTTPYSGQQVIVTYYLCFDQDAVQKAGLTPPPYPDDVHIPEMKQFIKDETYPLPKEPVFREQVIGGRTYAVAPLYQVALTPTKTGTLEVEPFQLSMQFPARTRVQMRPDPFGDPFAGMGDPFGLLGGTRIQVIANSPKLQFDVRPLPPGAPADFSGAVGDFAITDDLDRKDITEDDPVKLTIKIEGKGDAAAISKPVLPKMDGLQQLEEPVVTNKSRMEKEERILTKTFEYVLRPTKPGTIQIPPIVLSFFNPATTKYQSVQTQPLSLSVKPGTAKHAPLVAATTAPNGQPAAGNAPEGPKAVNQDIAYIKTYLHTEEPGTLSGEGPLFVALLLLPPAAVIAAFFFNRRRIAMETNRDHYRRVEAGSVARRHLKTAAKLMKSEDKIPFFEELARALRGYFSDKFRIDASSLTVENIEDQLRQRDVPDADIDRTRQLLNQCDSARYAPGRPDDEAVTHAYSEAADLIDRLERKK